MLLADERSDVVLLEGVNSIELGLRIRDLFLLSGDISSGDILESNLAANHHSLVAV